MKRNQGTAKQGETGRAVDGDGDARAKQTLGDDTMTGVMYSMALQPKSFVFSSTKCIDMFFFFTLHVAVNFGKECAMTWC